MWAVDTLKGIVGSKTKVFEGGDDDETVLLRRVVVNRESVPGEEGSMQGAICEPVEKPR